MTWKPSADIIDTAEDKARRAEEERRAAIPALTSRQFWLAALEIGVTKESLLQSIQAEYGGAEAAALAIEVNESASFSRHYPLVSELAEMKGIPENELDDLWLWASNI